MSEKVPGWLYHVTYYNRLASIAETGLVSTAARAIGQGAGYSTHSAQGIFLSAADGVLFWYGRAQAWAEHNSDNWYEDGLLPVVLRLSKWKKSALREDPIGTRDAYADAYIYTAPIPPQRLEIWNGEAWELLQHWDTLAPENAFTPEIDEESGDTIYWWNQDEPFLPSREQLEEG